jgi:hypothetical protein
MGGRLVWAELRIAGRELKADYAFSSPQACVVPSAICGSLAEAMAAPEATKAEGKLKRAVPQGQKRQDQQAAS